VTVTRLSLMLRSANYANSSAKRAVVKRVKGAGPRSGLVFQGATPASERGTVVDDGLKVDPVALHLGSSDMFNAVGAAAVDFVSHEDGLAEAEPGWIGSSQRALGELAAWWEVQHDQHKLKVDGLGSHVAEAMFSYVTNEDESARAFRLLRK
jgi:hypothetical protein